MRDGWIGILMLDTAFPRPPGDVGNPATFDGRVRYATVPRASVERVVKGDAEGLLAPFVAAGRQFAEEGAAVIGTSCGFLAPFQQALAEALPVPAVASALIAAREAASPGILTFDAASLGPRHLDAAAVPPGTPVEGMAQGGALQRAVLGDRPSLDMLAVEAEAVAAARRLHDRGARTLVLECTNLGPYVAAMRAATGLPTVGIADLLLTALRRVG